MGQQASSEINLTLDKRWTTPDISRRGYSTGRRQPMGSGGSAMQSAREKCGALRRRFDAGRQEIP
jgi:hypothetical protein